ncbi:IclR family transcriptional regulator C-terminal domain-containing protein [uncultured Xylophilus sp.]|uniref:IclR family transcriptional regulator domain-containing protein n=1 Tax=uncultured Xylophilus sp. TaxID=296832 RepID=UPI0025FE68A1|nr:IclR family transcriptional regulator C-terminal domain-containing protein [uncultured Xylophilus sp.]
MSLPTHADPAARGDLPASPRPGDSYVQSFARGLEVIRSFSSTAPRQTLSEVAVATGLTRAGARRILLTLETLGYVESDGRLFALTPRILDLGFAYLSSMPMWNLAEPLMEDLVEQVKESCSAAVLDGHEIVYVLRVPTHKIMKISLGVGSRLPACVTSLGRVLLAALPEDEARRRIAASPRPALTPHTETDVDALMARVREARSQGWCLLNQELEEGLVSIAAPVTDRAGRTVAAINVSGQINRTGVEALQQEILPRLRATADAISRRLQARGG